MKSAAEQTFFILCTFNSFHQGLNFPYSLVRVSLNKKNQSPIKEINEEIIDILLTNFYDLEPQDLFNGKNWNEEKKCELPELVLWPFSETFESVESQIERSKRKRQKVWH